MDFEKLARPSITIPFCCVVAALPIFLFSDFERPQAFSTSTTEIDFGFIEPDDETVSEVEVCNPLPQPVKVMMRSSCDGVDVQPAKFEMPARSKSRFFVELKRRSGDRRNGLF